MNKKTIRLLVVAISTVLCITMLASTCFASSQVSPADIKADADIKTENLVSAGNQIATIIRVVGIILSVIILMILGIKYMMGSASEKAEYKKTMIPYVVGAIVLFGASALAGAIVQLAQGITGS